MTTRETRTTTDRSEAGAKRGPSDEGGPLFLWTPAPREGKAEYGETGETNEEIDLLNLRSRLELELTRVVTILDCSPVSPVS